MTISTLFRPSPKYQAHRLIAIGITFLFLVLPFALFGLVPELGWVYLLIFMFANALWLVPTIILTPFYCRSIEYEFAERDLLVRRGIITRSESMVPYRMVTNVEVKRGPIARALGIGTLKVHTAGYSQQAQSEATLNGLSNWEEVRQQLLDRIHEHQADQPAATAATAPGRDTESGDVAVILGDILAEVRALREQR